MEIHNVISILKSLENVLVKKSGNFVNPSVSRLNGQGAVHLPGQLAFCGTPVRKYFSGALSNLSCGINFAFLHFLLGSGSLAV